MSRLYIGNPNPVLWYLKVRTWKKLYNESRSLINRISGITKIARHAGARLSSNRCTAGTGGKLQARD